MRSLIRLKMDEAARLAKAAEVCVLAGSIAEGVTVSMDVEQLISPCFIDCRKNSYGPSSPIAQPVCGARISGSKLLLRITARSIPRRLCRQ
jgi:hypothetical protein